MRHIERHRAFGGLFANPNLLQFHVKLITELVLQEEGELWGAHIPNPGLQFNGKILARVGSGINHFKPWTDPDIWLQAPEGDFLIFKEAMAYQ